MMVEVRQAASMASATAAPPVLPPASTAATLVSGVSGEGVEERAGKGSVELEPAREGDELPSWRSSRKMKRERAGCSGS